MPVFSAPDFDNHEQVVFRHDAGSGLRAIVAVHNTIRGAALGGIRMWNYADEQAAVDDALRLARSMAYKSAILKMPYGGAKAVIIGDPAADKTEPALEAMGRLIESFQGRWITGEDVNIGIDDIEVMRRETKYALGSRAGSGDPSPVTAHGVFHGLRAVAETALGVTSLAGVTVAVQGLGKVGYALCEQLHAAGAKLLVTDIDAGRVEAAAAAFGATPVAADMIYAAEADIYAPCALGATLNDATIPELEVKGIAGSANSQLAEARHGAELDRRGILYAPDYLINAAGYMNIVAEMDMVFEGKAYDHAAVLARAETIHDRLLEVFARAARDDIPPSEACDREAEAHMYPAAAEAIPLKRSA